MSEETRRLNAGIDGDIAKIEAETEKIPAQRPPLDRPAAPPESSPPDRGTPDPAPDQP